MTSYKMHPTNRAEEQKIDYLILTDETWLISYYCVDGFTRGVAGKINGCIIERYKSLNGI